MTDYSNLRLAGFFAGVTTAIAVIVVFAIAAGAGRNVTTWPWHVLFLAAVALSVTMGSLVGACAVRLAQLRDVTALEPVERVP
jgi:ABC-type Fe3+-siderophore transport system permease subunit